MVHLEFSPSLQEVGPIELLNPPGLLDCRAHTVKSRLVGTGGVHYPTMLTKNAPVFIDNADAPFMVAPLSGMPSAASRFVALAGAIEEGADGDNPASPIKRDETAEEKRERKKRKKEKKEKREKKQAEKLAASDMKEDV